MYPQKQQGYALLVTATMILLGLSITALVVGKSMYYDQKEQSSEYQQHMGFQAAEAGLEYGIGYLFNNESTVLQDTDSNGFIDPLSNSSVTNVALSNGGQYSITYTNTVADSYQTLEVAATGHASNGEAQRTIRQLLRIYPTLVNTPPAGIIAKEDVDLGGNVGIVNTVTGTTIWSGGGTDLSGSAGTWTTSGGAASSDSGTIGPDIAQNDAGLSSLSNDAFFTMFFGQSKATVEQNANLVFNNSGNTSMNSSLNGVVGKSIWINQTGGEARINAGTVIGSPSQPVILIVNGSLKANGGATIYGVVYVIGDWDNNGGGNLDIIGAAIVEGSLSSTGTPNVTYDSSVLNNATEIGQYTKVAGSWRDF